MKKGKLTLGLVVSLASIGALSACNEVTYSDGVVLSYVDPHGTRLDFTAEELFGTYQTTTGQISTDFSTVEEVLIRKYYKSGGGQNEYASLAKDAALAVQAVKEEADTNATNNKTSYQEEFEKLLDSYGVESIDELYEAKLYELEKEKFDRDFNSSKSSIEGIRDGVYADGSKAFPYSAEYGRGNDGYLLDQLPYHIAHILVKVSADSNNHTEGTITENEATKLSDAIKYIAGDEIIPGSSVTRSSFGDIARGLPSDDTGSAERFGQLSVMDRKQADEFVQEFRFGIYAYEAIYNQINLSSAANPYATKLRDVPDGSGDQYKLYEKLKFSADATYTDVSAAQSADEIAADLPEGEHYLKNYFSAGKGLGTIPYGAAVALGKDEVKKDPDLGYNVNNGEAIYYPRNILFNKYFNNHWVAVVTPNEIAYNDNAIAHPTGKEGDYTTENFVGAYKAEYGALPGFSVDTTAALPEFEHNVLTNEKGQIILAVRAGASSYQGVHLMAIERSALSEFGQTVDNGKLREIKESEHTDTADVTSLSEYYPVTLPKNSDFPSYTKGGSTEKKTTYINQFIESNEAYEKTESALEGRIKDYNSVADTFRLQSLIASEKITFNTGNHLVKDIKEKLQRWISGKRSSAFTDGVDSLDESWATYAEYLTRAEQARKLKKDGSQKLISETCAIGYLSDAAKNQTAGTEWAEGGACYAKKK